MVKKGLIKRSTAKVFTWSSLGLKLIDSGPEGRCESVRGQRSPAIFPGNTQVLKNHHNVSRALIFDSELKLFVAFVHKSNLDLEC